MKDEDIRWKQRFQNFEKACSKLENALSFYIKEPGNELYQMALVQSFEFTFELGWKTLKDFLSHSGIKKISLPRDVINQGFHHHIIADGQMWIEMMQDSNLMAHTYSEENAQKAVTKISQVYHSGIKQLYHCFKNKMEGN